MVPIIVDLSGNQTITVTPTLTNSGIVCFGAIVVGSGENGRDFDMRISIYAEPELGADTSLGRRTGECGGIYLPPRNTLGNRGDYNIYYVDKLESFPTINQAEHYLGTVR